ncbi:hypothetical protein F4678DRAFT_478375 [Xylaria arbuscula]|nr:hypothetical protein F4678DRAFT_478375 [Xylaria arbuscula]
MTLATEVHNDQSLAALQLLADYKIHHSAERDERDSRNRQLVTVADGIQRESQPSDFDSSLAPHPLVPYPVTNPVSWPQHWRRVPDYRPVNPELDVEERRQKPLFFVIGGIMVWGCCFVASWASIWRNTGGKITDILITRVGGEW